MVLLQVLQADLQMELAGAGDDVFAGLLDHAQHHGAGLGESLEALELGSTAIPCGSFRISETGNHINSSGDMSMGILNMGISRILSWQDLQQGNM